MQNLPDVPAPNVVNSRLSSTLQLLRFEHFQLPPHANTRPVVSQQASEKRDDSAWISRWTVRNALSVFEQHANTDAVRPTKRLAKMDQTSMVPQKSQS